MAHREAECDVLVVGSGAAGLTAAIAAARAGSRVVVVEQEPLYGGTTAYSGGMLWIPCNRHSATLVARGGREDSRAAARAYVRELAGDRLDAARLDAYLEHGPRMVDFLERESEVRFYPMDYPDYTSESPHSRMVRSLCTQPYSTRRLGPHLKHLRNQLPQTLFLGLAIGSSVEMKEFMRAGRSLKSFAFVAKRLAAHGRDLLVYGRSEQRVRGRALVGRLARTVFDLGIPLHLSTALRELVVEDGRVRGALVGGPDGTLRIAARRGVILACGGYGRDAARRAATYPRVAGGADHPTVVAPGNTGDGVRLALAAGAGFVADVQQVASWMPVSRIPGRDGVEHVWPHLVDRQKPGFIAVSRAGRRFVDESSSYHDFVPGTLRASEREGEPESIAWIIADERAVRRWGIGFVRPWPVPKSRYLRNGYLLRGRTLRELATKAGIDADGLETTVRAFNEHARRGVDPEFGRGGRTYHLYQGDDEVQPNPCLAPLEAGPFYAVRVHAAEIGTFAGLATDAAARVLDARGRAIPGLYAVGNDQANVFASAYPGAGSTLGPAMTFGYLAGRHAAGMDDVGVDADDARRAAGGPARDVAAAPAD